jgi:hypothetical protein
MDASVPLELCMTDVIQSQYKDVIRCSGRVFGDILEISELGNTSNGLIQSGMSILPYEITIMEQIDGPPHSFGNIGRYRLSDTVVLASHGFILISKSKSPSEFILSLPKRKRFLSLFKEFKFDRTHSQKTDDLVLELYRLLNAFVFKDPILDRIFDYLCRVRNNPPELASCATIRRYLCPELLEQPYYEQLRHTFGENGLSLGDYSTKPLYIMYMSGMLVGYAITNVLADTETLLVSHFDTYVLRAHFMTMHPIIQ